MLWHWLNLWFERSVHHKQGAADHNEWLSYCSLSLLIKLMIKQKKKKKKPTGNVCGVLTNVQMCVLGEVALIPEIKCKEVKGAAGSGQRNFWLCKNKINNK